MKLCKNCKHISYCETKCQRPIGERTSLVTGDTYVGKMNNNAEKERSYNYFNSIIHKACGKSGRFFEDNTEELLKKRLADEELIKSSRVMYAPFHSQYAKSLDMQMRQDILDKLHHQVVNPNQFKLQNWAMSTIKPTFKVEPLV